LQVVGDGVELTADGLLPLETVRGLDDRFRWTDDFPWMRVRDETDIAPLSLLRQHLMAQELLRRDGRRLVPTTTGTAVSQDTGRLWDAIVDPGPRWPGRFERDALAVMAASVLRSVDYAADRVAGQMAHVLATKWRPGHQASGGGGRLAGLTALAQTWYRLGVPLGWWDTGRGPADRRPNSFGRAAAVTVFRIVAGRPEG
ncbi:MAG: hypothetical protein WB441_06755, partial [Nocardioidaceae bacterium]